MCVCACKRYKIFVTLLIERLLGSANVSLVPVLQGPLVEVRLDAHGDLAAGPGQDAEWGIQDHLVSPAIRTKKKEKNFNYLIVI